MRTIRTSIFRPQVVAATALAATALLGGTAYASSLSAGSGNAENSGSSYVAPAQAHLKSKPSSPQLAHCFPYAGPR